MKRICLSIISITAIGLAASVYAEDEMTTTTTSTTSTTTTTTAPAWKGEFYNIMSNKAGITEEYCKAHVLDTYPTSASMVDKEVKADNGVMAKNLHVKMREEGGIYVITGTAEFMGTTDGKEWKDKVRFLSHALTKDGMHQGVWYTNDCKGFYKVGPA